MCAATRPTNGRTANVAIKMSEHVDRAPMATTEWADLTYLEEVAPASGTTPPTSSTGTTTAGSISLDGRWRARMSPTATDDAASPVTCDTGLTNWSDLAVPAHWAFQGFGTPWYTNTQFPFPLDPPHVPFENPTVSYVRDFDHLVKPATNTLLRFDGIESIGQVWLNDVLVGVTRGSRYNGNYAPNKALDTVVGSSGTGEWASQGTSNPWLQLAWTQPVTMNRITLWDRANGVDNANGGTLTFSDGSTVSVSGIPTDGTPKTVTFPDKSVTSVRFQVSGGAGPNVGLAEIAAVRMDPGNLAASATVTGAPAYDSRYLAANATDGITGVSRLR